MIDGRTRPFSLVVPARRAWISVRTCAPRARRSNRSRGRLRAAVALVRIPARVRKSLRTRWCRLRYFSHGTAPHCLGSSSAFAATHGALVDWGSKVTAGHPELFHLPERQASAAGNNVTVRVRDHMTSLPGAVLAINAGYHARGRSGLDGPEQRVRSGTTVPRECQRPRCRRGVRQDGGHEEDCRAVSGIVTSSATVTNAPSLTR